MTEKYYKPRPDLKLAFEKYENGLMPAITQDSKTGQILMLGFVTQEALAETLRTGLATFWSRERNELWTKGLTSGDTLKIVEIRTDCDTDTLLYIVEQQGNGACHKEGWESCFSRIINQTNGQIIDLLPDPEEK